MSIKVTRKVSTMGRSIDLNHHDGEGEHHDGVMGRGGRSGEREPEPWHLIWKTKCNTLCYRNTNQVP
jgi:hypothetical protein